ncbi:MAG TPA: 16S rRNA (cytosine(1402)-N(4))-methyltransferase RsmH [Anaerolineales bacterium]|nr:16S rRNA (cytosine(1402)-N(4))-methyltransferase RsmH [Anaerolineales bacterium]
MGELDGYLHRPVLYQEVIDALLPTRGGRYIDGTLGAGGHAYGVLQASSPDGKLLGFDVDPQALEIARLRLQPFGDRVHIVQSSYTEMGISMQRLGWSTVQGVLLDLGVSSMQLNTPGRGFSFQVDAPLDMRFSPHAQTSAADLVNSLTETELAKILFEYGEERRARQIAKAIIQARPVTTTRQLSDLIMRISSHKDSFQRHEKSGRKKMHPATRTFQALRIAVNQELQAIEMVMPKAVSALSTGGRLAVISFHSLEDRIVKQFFRHESRDCICPPKQPVCTCGHKASLVEINRRPIIASQAEMIENPRARSAKLRVIEKL